MNMQLLSVGVRTFGDLQAQILISIQQPVDVPYLTMNVDNSFQRKNRVFVGVGNQQRSRSNEGGDFGIIPPVCVNHEHAVAMTFDAAVHHMIAQRRSSSDRNSTANAFIKCGDPPAVGTATGPTCDTNSGRIHLRTSLKIIQRPNTVPRFDSRRRVAAGVPPPAIHLVGAMMNPLNLSQLQSINDQAVVPVTGKPASVIVIMSLIAVADAVLFDLSMTANIQNGRQWFISVLWPIEITCDVEPWHGLKVNSFDNEFRFFGHSLHHRLQRCFCRQRIQPKHIEQLLSQLRLGFIPFCCRLKL